MVDQPSNRTSQGKIPLEGKCSAYPQGIALQAILDFDFRQPLDLSIELTLLVRVINQSEPDMIAGAAGFTFASRAQNITGAFTR